jgi:CheY-like chemotaxis protein
MSQYRGLENKRILVVEDVEMNQYLARHIMESWGCVVEIAENGARAIEKVNQQDFDLVLMDIQMPVMDGLQATTIIREMEDSHKSSVPVVALTANVGKSDYDTYARIGMNDCLPKPFQEAALFKAVYKNIRKEKNNRMKVNAFEEDVVTDGPDETFSAKLYDLSMVEAISGGDRSFINKMLHLFIQTVPVTLNEMHVAAGAGEWVTLSKLAHKLKSTIDSMGIKELNQDVRNVEANAKSGQEVEELPALVTRITEVMQDVIKQVKRDHSL